LKSQIAKSQITNADGSASREGGIKSNDQFPMPTVRHQTKTKSLDSSCCFVYCDLQFEFYLRFVILFEIWDFQLASLDLYPTGLVRVRQIKLSKEILPS